MNKIEKSLSRKKIFIYDSKMKSVFDKSDIKVLLEEAKKINYDDNEEIVIQAISTVEKKYKIMQIYSLGMEQVIEFLKYRMMLKLLGENHCKKARKYCKKFSKNMRICIIDRLNGEKEELVKNGMEEESLKLESYICKHSMSEKDLKLWELILRIERPELNYRLPKKY